MTNYNKDLYPIDHIFTEPLQTGSSTGEDSDTAESTGLPKITGIRQREELQNLQRSLKDIKDK